MECLQSRRRVRTDELAKRTLEVHIRERKSPSHTFLPQPVGCPRCILGFRSGEGESLPHKKENTHLYLEAPKKRCCYSQVSFYLFETRPTKT